MYTYVHVYFDAEDSTCFLVSHRADPHPFPFPAFPSTERGTEAYPDGASGATRLLF